MYAWERVRRDIEPGVSSWDDVLAQFDDVCQDLPELFFDACDEMTDMKSDMSNHFMADFPSTQICDFAGLCGTKLFSGIFSLEREELMADVESLALQQAAGGF